MKNGFFLEEFETIFKEQFRSTRHYETIVKILSQGPANLSQLARATTLEKGGGLKLYLSNLEKASFVREYQTISFGRNSGVRTKTYKLIDPFLGFYFHFIQPNKKLIEKNNDKNLFEAITRNRLPIFFGLQFERLCEDSLLRLLKAVKLSLTDLKNFGPFFQQKTIVGQGVQFDMVLEQRNGIITLFEFKFQQKPTGATIVKETQSKIDRMNFPPHLTVEKGLISMSGFTPEVKKSKYFDHLLTLEDLYP